jgi:hypothetical protein
VDPTRAFAEFRSSIVLVEIVLGLMSSLNVTVTAALVAMLVEPLGGATATTVGAVVSDPAGVKTTSTQ